MVTASEAREPEAQHPRSRMRLPESGIRPAQFVVNVPTPGVDGFTFIGTITPTQINLNYTVTFTGGGGAVGLLQVNKDATNQVPMAVALPAPNSIQAGDHHTTVVTIDASGSSDPDGDPLRYSWVVPSGTFVNGTSNTEVTIQVTFPGAAPYTVTVTVNDGQGGTDTASITIMTSEGLEQ